MMLDQFNKIGVVGAGTMGIGIAEVAATFGHEVYIYDLDQAFANAAKQKMADRLQSRVERNKITSDTRKSILDHLIIIDDLQQMSECQMVIEAIVEKLHVKQQLFKQLQEVCDQNVLFASNTSSISITAIASALHRPENMIGLHFFNPAPVMKLVEVISGLKTASEHIHKAVELCRFWNKTPVVAKSSPGFIVNRVARPFYGEAMKMLQEQVASNEIIDAVMTSAGFRMGPFVLMDLIGIDINFSVSQTVFEAMFFDPRYRPSLIQQEMVAANLLGKKSGQGFYNYNGEDQAKSITYEAANASTLELSINKSDHHGLGSLIKHIEGKYTGHINSFNNTATLVIGDCSIVLANGMTCQQRLMSVETSHIAQIDLALDYSKARIIHLCFNKECPDDVRSPVIGLFQSLGHEVVIGKDQPAQIAMRTVAMLINEAADAVENGICSETDVDLAMQKGVNYPIGLLDWASQIGIDHVVETLDHLHRWFGDDRYRVSAWLRRRC